MRTTLEQLASMVDGTVVGECPLPLEGAATLTEAAPGQLSFLDHPKLVSQLAESEASALVVPREWDLTSVHGDVGIDLPVIQVDHVRTAFAKIVAYFRPPLVEPRLGISPLAQVDATATLGQDVDVHPHAVIGPEVVIGDRATIHANVTIMGRCRLGDDVTVYPGAVLYRDTEVGDRVVIHANAVLGAYGFGYDTVQGQHLLGDQLGFVRLEDDVEIGAATTVDRGSFGATVIGQGTKIDNQVMVAHNCRIGRHNLICSQVGIAGSSQTGDYVVMAGQVGVPDHVRIGHRAILGAKSGIMRDVPDGTTVLGIPATPEREQMAKQAAFIKLPEMRRQLRKLIRQVNELVERQGVAELNAAPSSSAKPSEAA